MFNVDHLIPVSQRPDLVFDERNCRRTHTRCNNSKGKWAACTGTLDTGQLVTRNSPHNVSRASYGRKMLSSLLA